MLTFKLHVIFLLSVGLLMSCGGDTDPTTNSNGPTSNGTTASSASSSAGSAALPSTIFISNYLALYHAQEFEKFLKNEDSLSAALSASGEFSSGVHYSQSQKNYQNTIDGFSNGALLFIQTTAQQMPVDKAATISLINQFMADDKLYVSTYYSSVSWGMSKTSLDAFIESTQKEVEKSYSLIILTIYIP